ncbi:hypothetical protein [Salinisphaera orenii]|uniref:Uncharacterized protein n=1 Tax=Salinisphaera orenii YIM 95161 TaxID=1051139 RepID=A0A423PRW1_9GAMM|nr:hypothetical protein [Salinisphaera halophila]ROO28261.1 hypothetical protein SAHL_10650 [Salinisphaera halophila YIM 95161]
MSQLNDIAHETAHRIVEQAGGPTASFDAMSAAFKQLIVDGHLPIGWPPGGRAFHVAHAAMWSEVIRLQLAALEPNEASRRAMALSAHLDYLHRGTLSGDR